MIMTGQTKEIHLGNGLRLTESSDMGIFLHYKTKSGKSSGEKISNVGYDWAVELLSNDEPSTKKDNIKSLNKKRVFNKEGELSKRISSLIDEYAGEISLVSVLGVLDLKKHELIG